MMNFDGKSRMVVWIELTEDEGRPLMADLSQLQQKNPETQEFLAGLQKFIQQE